MYRGALEICQEIAELESERSTLDWNINTLKLELEELVGMDYDDFMDGMRRMMEPV